MFMLMCVNQICYLFLPSLTADIIDKGVKHADLNPSQLSSMTPEEIVSFQTSCILKIGFLMLFVTLISVFITVIINRIMAKISANISADIKKDIFYKVLNASYLNSNKFSPSSLMTRLTSDSENVKSFIIMSVQIVVPPTLLVGGIFMSFKTCPSLTPLILFGAFVAGMIAFVSLKVVASKAKLLQETEDNFNLTVRQQLEGTAVIRSFGNFDFENERFEKINRKFSDISFFINKVTAVMSPLMILCANLLTVSLLWFSSVKIFNQEMMVGDLVAFMQYSFMIVGAFVMLSLMASVLPRMIVSIKRVGEILECEEEISSGKKEFPKDFSGSIEFNNVDFKYPGACENSLDSVSFCINYGETVGIIGSVGSGKTTLLRLILGLCEPCKGKIHLGGENILDFNKTSLLENISYVSQKSAVFSGSFKSNLTLGSENFDETELQNALKIVKLQDLVAEKGLETPIFQQGKNLSGGQKQRLALARSLLKKGRIYIFDDSFSSLDFKTEAEVRNEILKKLCGKTLIFVSQRISTIKNADKIIVLNDGKIAAIGTHDELLKSCEIYKKIADLQNGGEISNER